MKTFWIPLLGWISLAHWWMFICELSLYLPFVSCPCQGMVLRLCQPHKIRVYFLIFRSNVYEIGLICSLNFCISLKMFTIRWQENNQGKGENLNPHSAQTICGFRLAATQGHCYYFMTQTLDPAAVWKRG